jgi:hypothetical protein
MNCEYWSKVHPVCKLGLYGGMPSIKTCEICVKNNENNKEFFEETKQRSNISHPSTARKVSGCCDSAKNYH